jgi:hypothetical protein
MSFKVPANSKEWSGLFESLQLSDFFSGKFIA